ncbi:MAG: FAD-dependent oxidoreductase [Marinobacter sp.]|uniref:NAD(P)/FAD-dependent oxidoreductase n=1 Tax=Marinobacter sp. TaxID=50741 RepID=UPI00299EA7E9|nr:FAD-dependent oxidoreductase [Marinobacter sp.]MDX1755019.1 FAD-dependent oxidoreductase [Marinobacter sp.]
MQNETISSHAIRQVAVLGSGMAGLTVALRLRERGVSVNVFEKSRGPGGRLASTRVTAGTVDCGAQYFTIRTSAFGEFLARYAGDSYGLWQGRLARQAESGGREPFTPARRYVGVPRMSAVSRALASQLVIRTRCQVTRLGRTSSGQWQLEDSRGELHGGFDAVVVTAPPVQTEALFRQSGLGCAANRVLPLTATLQACYAVMVHFAEPLGLPFEGLESPAGPLRWAANDSSKPGRTGRGEWWVLHGAPAWSREHVGSAPDTVIASLLAEFQRLAPVTASPDQALSHCWLYARFHGPGAHDPIWFPDDRLGVCGDWLQGGRVEGAFESAERLLAVMTLDTRRHPLDRSAAQ